MPNHDGLDWLHQAKQGGLSRLELRLEEFEHATEAWIHGQQQLIESLLEVSALLEQLDDESDHDDQW